MLGGLNAGLRQLTAREFAALGMEYVAYVKPAHVDGRDAYTIHAADGREVAVVETQALAVATVRQNDLEPLSLH